MSKSETPDLVRWRTSATLPHALSIAVPLQSHRRAIHGIGSQSSRVSDLRPIGLPISRNESAAVERNERSFCYCDVLIDRAAASAECADHLLVYFDRREFRHHLVDGRDGASVDSIDFTILE